MTRFNDDTISSTLIKIGVLIIFVVLLLWAVSDHGNHKYAVTYAGYHNIQHSDYTNEIKHFPDHIEYINEHGKLVQRYGTFEITIKR